MSNSKFSLAFSAVKLPWGNDDASYKTAVPVCAAVLGSAWLLLSTARSYYEFTRINCPAPSTLELAGHMVRHSGDVGKFLMALVDRHGFGPLKMHFCGGMVKLAVVSSPDMQKLSKMPKGKFYALLNTMFGDNLITLNHYEHKRHRNLLSRGFSFGALYSFLPAFDFHAQRLVDAWEDREVVEIHDWMTKVTFDVISDMAFGYDAQCLLGSTEGEKFAHECCWVASTVMLHFLHIPGFAQLYKLWHRRHFSFVDSMIYKQITNRRAEHASRNEKGRTPPVSPKASIELRRKSSTVSTTSTDEGEESDKGQPKPRDLLDMMMFSGTWTDSELRDEGFIFFVAGHETTAVTLAWILAHISADLPLQKRLRKEIFGVLGDDCLQKGTEKQLPLLTNTIKEGLRMYPPAFAITRFIEEDVNIDGTILPAGYDCMINLIGLQRNPACFERPNDFDPDRWAAEPNPTHYFPFSFGPRECIGKNFAWLEQKSILCKVLRSYELRLEGEIPDWTTLPISTTPAAPVRVRLRKLENSEKQGY